MRFKGLDLNLIPVLHALLQQRSTVRTAEELHISQPAISAALNRLREYFKDPLFLVQGRQMVPTAFALQLQPHLLAFLADADILVNTSAVFDPAISSRTFRIGVSDYLAIVLFRPLLQRLANEAPGLAFELMALTEDMTSQLDRGDLDLLLSPTEYLSSENPVITLLNERYVVAGWTGNPLMRGPITSEAFRNAGHVAVKIGRLNRSSFAESQLRALGVDRRVEVIAPGFGLAAPLLIGTDRIAVMHGRLAAYMASQLPIALSPLPFDFPLLVEGLQFHRSRANDAGLQWLVEQIHAEIRNIDKQSTVRPPAAQREPEAPRLAQPR